MHEVLRRFDRETGWLATGLLGGLILAAMAIGVQLQKHRREQVNLPTKTMEFGVDHPAIFQPQTDETATAATPDLNSDHQIQIPKFLVRKSRLTSHLSV